MKFLEEKLYNFIQRALGAHAGQAVELKKIFSFINYVFLEKIFRVLISFAIGVMVTRYLGPEKYGVLSFIIAFVTLLTPLSSLGLEDVLIVEIKHNPKNINAILGTAFFMRIVGTVLMLVLSCSVMYYCWPNDEMYVFFVFLYSISYFFISFDVIDVYFQSQVEAKPVTLAKQIGLIISTLAKLILIFIQAPLKYFFYTFILDAFIVALVLVYFYYKKADKSIFNWRISFDKVIVLIKRCLPLMLATFAILIYMKIDQVMIKQILGDYKVGIYAVAVNISEIFYIVPVTIISSFFPAIISSRKRSLEEYGHRLQKLYNYTILVSVALIIPVVFVSKFVIGLLFGQNFIEASPILNIYVSTTLFVVFAVISGKTLILEGAERLILNRTIVGALVNVLLNFILIPRFELYGAAVATIVAYILAVFFYDICHFETRENFKRKCRSLMLHHSIKSIFFLKEIDGGV